MSVSLAVNATTTGDNTLLPAVANKYYVVYAFNLVANVATTFSLKDGNTPLTGPMTYPAGGSLSMSLSDTNTYWRTTPGQALKLNIGSLLGQVGGFILYDVLDV